jgi:Ca-activated chloride channel family protein
MYNFQLTQSEREYWLSLALSRNEMERGSADDRDAVYWSGQTLQEMQSIVRKPMTLAVDSIKEVMQRLQTGDTVSVVAFADQTYTCFTDNDWITRPDFCRNALDDLLEQRYPFEIGTGTKMAAALYQAVQHMANLSSDGGVQRIIVLSDGIVQDRNATFEAIEKVREHDFAVSTIGVGDEFDEEFLMRIADDSRGQYYYAHNIDEIADNLLSELTTIQATSLHQVFIEAEGLAGAVVQDVYLVSPTMGIFDEMDTGGSTLRARIGDLAGDKQTLLLLQVAPPLLPAGVQDLAEVTLTWREPGSGGDMEDQTTNIKLAQGFSDDANLLAQRDATVQDYVDRFKIYRYEREAQHLQEKGDIDAAREKLGAATRELQRLGETDLAHDLEEQIANLETGYSDPSRVKRIKATTRKLAEKMTPGAS